MKTPDGDRYYEEHAAGEIRMMASGEYAAVPKSGYYERHMFGTKEQASTYLGACHEFALRHRQRVGPPKAISRDCLAYKVWKGQKP